MTTRNTTSTHQGCLEQQKRWILCATGIALSLKISFKFWETGTLKSWGLRLLLSLKIFPRGRFTYSKQEIHIIQKFTCTRVMIKHCNVQLEEIFMVKYVTFTTNSSKLTANRKAFRWILVASPPRQAFIKKLFLFFPPAISPNFLGLKHSIKQSWGWTYNIWLYFKRTKWNWSKKISQNISIHSFGKRVRENLHLVFQNELIKFHMLFWSLHQILSVTTGLTRKITRAIIQDETKQNTQKLMQIFTRVIERINKQI